MSTGRQCVVRDVHSYRNSVFRTSDCCCFPHGGRLLSPSLSRSKYPNHCSGGARARVSRARHRMNHRLRAALAALLLLLAAASGHASEVARADLSIVGVSLEVDTARVNTAVDVPAYVQTIFGGKKNDQAAHVDGVSVLGDLTGPGLDTPITLFTAPGQ